MEINLGDVCRSHLEMQAQYGCRYADPYWNDKGFPYCAEGLRVTLNPSKDYHNYTIHSDDVDTFVGRVKMVLKARGIAKGLF